MDGKRGIWSFQALNQKKNIQYFIRVHEREEVKRDESRFIVRLEIVENVFGTPPLNLLQKANVLYKVGPPHLRAVSQFGSDERNEETLLHTDRNRDGERPPDETQSLICLRSHSIVMFCP